jgi:hypothetical protein
MQQTLIYNIYLPNIGEHFNINGINFIVISYENINPPYDSIIVQNIVDKSFTRLVVVNGKWKPDDGIIYTINFNEFPQTQPIIQQLTIQPTIQQPIIQRQTENTPLSGVLYIADKEPGGNRKLGTTTSYPFRIISMGTSDMNIDFGDNFPPYLYSTGKEVSENGAVRPISTGGLRTLTKRKNENWIFKGYGRLYAGDRIEFI